MLYLLVTSLILLITITICDNSTSIPQLKLNPIPKVILSLLIVVNILLIMWRISLIQIL